MKHVAFLDEARVEFLAQAAWYERERAGLGGRFTLAVERAAERVAQWPHIGMTDATGARRTGVAGFPVSLVYRERDDDVVVIAVAHHAREPEFWRDR